MRSADRKWSVVSGQWSMVRRGTGAAKFSSFSLASWVCKVLDCLPSCTTDPEVGASNRALISGVWLGIRAGYKQYKLRCGCGGGPPPALLHAEDR